MQLPDAIIFDLDDTIVDDSSAVVACWEQSLREAAVSIPGYNTEQLWTAIEQERDWYWGDPARHREGRLDLRAASTRIVEQALVSLGHEAGGIGAVIANRYRDLREERVTLLPNAMETLKWFHNQGVVLGMATNGSASGQRAKIERFGLTEYFERIIIEEEFGFGKPERQVYEALFESLGADPAKTWFVGDNLEFDVAAPQSFGVYGIWVDVAGRGVPAGSVVRPDRVIRGVGELIQA
jgi:putative hydrolase of the HAD superfamily